MTTKWRLARRGFLSSAAAAGGLLAMPGIIRAQDTSAAITKWIDEFQPSTLSRDEQMKELNWFAEAAKPFRGMAINVVSETLDTHVYESQTLAKAFSEITGIRLTHDLLQEGDVVEKLQTAMQSNQNVYDAWVNDSDFIGTHSRWGKAVNLSEWMAGDGKDVTLATLDVDDFMGKSFTTGPNGQLYQIPDQQFANLYWFRQDWFERPELRENFKKIYGYELGVPVNWSAYEDIAEFFTDHVKELDGKRVYGHMDYGKKDPSLGWRFTDAWLSMAGEGDKGIPNGLPVDEWGIRMEGCRPVGSSMSRGGGTNSPAAVYALTKYIEWLKKYAPPEAPGMTFSEAGPVPGQGQIAQQIFWYSAFTASSIKPDLPVMNKDGTPKWRMAPSPHGPYWEQGMKLGYQDCGSWTLMNATPLERRKPGWLYAQFCISKTTSLRKTIVGLTPIRDSDIRSKPMDEMAPKLGGLVEFYRSPARVAWTPTGNNVPDYARLAQLWWSNVAEAVTGEQTPQGAMDNLAKQQDDVLRRLERQKIGGDCAPKLNKEEDVQVWYDRPGEPKPKLANEKPAGVTVTYDRLLTAWKENKVMPDDVRG